MNKPSLMVMLLSIGFIGSSSSARATDWLIAHDLSGVGVPAAPKLDYDSRDEALCQGEAREATSAPDRAPTRRW